MPNLQQQLAVELCRRANLLPREVDEWNKQSDANDYGMGIHQKQVRAVTRLFNGMLKSQDGLKQALDRPEVATMPQEDFTKKRQKLEQSLTGTHSIMATFRYIFSQRDPTQSYKRILDAADLVAAHCYLPCIKLANRWKGESDEHHRAPPLVYLNAKLSPAAILRRHKFGLIGLELQAEVERQLPISIISLSFHDTVAFWSFSSIYHEVGHVLDEDLGLRAQLGAAIQTKMGTSQHKELWGKTWLGEMIADAFGVLLGGAGFVGSLMSMLFKTKEEVVESSIGVHPNSYVRIFLLGALLRRTGVDELEGIAETIQADWSKFYGPAPLWQSFIGECEAVADVLLTEPLPALEGRCMLDFARNNKEVKNAPDLKKDSERMEALATYLRFTLMTKEYTAAMTLPESLIRLVPAAAQLAVQNVDADHGNKFGDLQKRAVDFVLDLQNRAQINFLAEPDSAEHDAYLDQLIQNLDFAALEIDNT